VTPSAFEAVDASISEVTKARAFLSKIKSKQIRNIDAVAALKSTAHAWFNTHRPAIAASAPSLDLGDVDTHYTSVLNATAKHASKRTYLDALNEAKKALIAARAEALIAPSASSGGSDELPPDFSPLAGNQEMRDILTRRWHECRRCVGADAHLAAIVMMGGVA
jgi:hypothetical protein